jgi:hypothetical protein
MSDSGGGGGDGVDHLEKSSLFELESLFQKKREFLSKLTRTAPKLKARVDQNQEEVGRLEKQVGEKREELRKAEELSSKTTLGESALQQYLAAIEEEIESRKRKSSASPPEVIDLTANDLQELDSLIRLTDAAQEKQKSSDIKVTRQECEEMTKVMLSRWEEALKGCALRNLSLNGKIPTFTDRIFIERFARHAHRAFSVSLPLKILPLQARCAFCFRDMLKGADAVMFMDVCEKCVYHPICAAVYVDVKEPSACFGQVFGTCSDNDESVTNKGVGHHGVLDPNMPDKTPSSIFSYVSVIPNVGQAAKKPRISGELEEIRIKSTHTDKPHQGTAAVPVLSSTSVQPSISSSPQKSSSPLLNLAPPQRALYEKDDIYKAISNKKGVKLAWQGFLTEGWERSNLEKAVVSKIDAIRNAVSVAHNTCDKTKLAGIDMSAKRWYLQVYITSGEQTTVLQTAILLTSPNRAYFWKADGVKASLQEFFNNPTHVAKETGTKLSKEYSDRTQAPSVDLKRPKRPVEKGDASDDDENKESSEV